MKIAEALETITRTDPGRVRSHNEDAVFADAGMGLVILADGMGGYNAGEVASGMATNLLASNFAQLMGTATAQEDGAVDGAAVRERLLDEIAVVNEAIFRASVSEAQYAGMGTTLVVASFYDNRLCVAHLGDSRLYRLRGGLLAQLTRDHSLLQEQLDSGVISAEEARHSQNKNLLTRALGVDSFVDTEINDYPVQEGDVYLLCSDGLNDMLDDAVIGAVMQDHVDDLELAADLLIQMANDQGGRDNISVILVKVLGDYSAPKGWWRKLLVRLK